MGHLVCLLPGGCNFAYMQNICIRPEPHSAKHMHTTRYLHADIENQRKPIDDGIIMVCENELREVLWVARSSVHRLGSFPAGSDHAKEPGHALHNICGISQCVHKHKQQHRGWHLVPLQETELCGQGMLSKAVGGKNFLTIMVSDNLQY